MQDAVRTTWKRNATGERQATSNPAGELNGIRTRRMRELVRVTMLLSTVAVAAPAWADESASSTPTREITVRMYRDAVVAGNEIHLSDVAEVEKADAGMATDWVVATAPTPGGSRTLAWSDLQRSLGGQGVDLSRWIFRGAMRCTVHRPRLADSSAPSTPVAPSATRPDGSSKPDARVSPKSLEGHIRRFVARRLGHLGGEPTIQFSSAVRKLLALSEPGYRFAIKERSDRRLGLVALEVTIYRGDEVEQVLPVLLQVSLRKRIVVASRAINQSEIIEREALALVPRTFDRVADIGVSKIDALVGQRAKRFIPQDRTVTMRDVEPMPLVERNDVVTVWVRRGGITIKAAGKAMGSAGYGETVMLKNESSRETFSAVVIARREAEIVAPQPSGLASAASHRKGGR